MSSAITIPILEKSIGLLKSVAASETGQTVKHLSESLKIPSATCYRIVRTLVKHDWLYEKAKGEFHLAYGFAQLARSYAEIEHLLNLIMPRLSALAAATGLSAKVSLREGNNAVTAARAEPLRVNAISSPVGAQFPLISGSAGAILLAALSDEEVERMLRSLPQEQYRDLKIEAVIKRVRQARRDGTCWELGQQHPSIYAVSVPLKLGLSIHASLSLVGWPDEFDEPKRKGLEKTIRAAAAEFQKHSA